ncbi:AAEL012917-PA, partial [Aedes aegypti]
DEDLLLNPKDHPELKLKDIVEIYDPDDDGVRLLLQVTCLTEECMNKETISVEANIALAFNLKPYKDVYMRKVDPSEVALDSVEITFKDQYMGRSEMWRLKTYLTNTCVYLNKKIEYCENCIRCQVYEMWSQGDRVACGVITEDTKVVFRSNTSMVYLFIQMSSEMWDFDIHGDLYFEKAVNGFLADLYTKWKKLGSNHEVTIVMFSRTFYAAKSLDEFPLHMRDCLQMDYKGRYYEDFYRVAIQNERCDDWSSTLVQLRRLFTGYRDVVLKYHERPDVDMKIPSATNSTAAQGNFLEVLNISLNVFEKHYLDRSFDRTGQLSVVITPGVGVFEVDRELTNITKQRIIDNGVGSDLVCVGEQPLHAVPLLKFHNKDSLTSIDDYSMPHWINLSFYSTNKTGGYASFIPRIKPPPVISESTLRENPDSFQLRLPKKESKNEYIHNCLFDYDAYDDQIFQLPSVQGTCSLQRVARTKKTSVPSLDNFGTYGNNREWENMLFPTDLRRKMSDPDIHHNTTSMLNLSLASHNSSPSATDKLGEKNINRSFGSSSGPVVRTGRALINPFDPSHVTIKLTSNRRRWTHIFPKGPQGVLIQQHHYQAVPAATSTANYTAFDLDTSSEYAHTLKEIQLSFNDIYRFTQKFSEANSITEVEIRMGKLDELWESYRNRRKSGLHSAAGPTVTVTPSKSLTLLWGVTGEQEWTPSLTTHQRLRTAKCLLKQYVLPTCRSISYNDCIFITVFIKGRMFVLFGVDWKSLTIPACLPITTDYFPDKRSLHNDYVVSDYTLLPDDVNAEFAQNRAIYKKPLSTEEVFRELVSQRLAQGFQLIVLPEKTSTNPQQAPCSSFQSSVLRIRPPQEPSQEYLLSIGRIFHKISLSGSVITVTRYRPRHPYPPINVDYRYRFHAPQHDTYEVSGVNFTTEKLENFNWNYMDQYICTRGDTDFQLIESMKYWRYRMYLLPKEDPAMKKILEGTAKRCDIYTENKPIPSDKHICNEFIKFVELHLNKIKKIPCKKPRQISATYTKRSGPPSHLTKRRHSTSIISRPPPNQVSQNQPYRERVGSNRLPEKPRLSQLSATGGKPAVDGIPLSTLNSAAEQGLPEDSDDFCIETSKQLKPTATLQEIFDAFKNPISGVGFLGPAQSMPSCTFVSYDAITWLQEHIEGPCNPIEILEDMRRNRMICHASGEYSKPVIPGFCLYYIMQQNKESRDYLPPLGDLEAFENEWMEVEVQHPDLQRPIDPIDVGVQPFLRETIDFNEEFVDRPLYKQTHLDIDVNNKSDRIEWGHARYHQKMIPGHAFEIVVQWITASGPIVSDLIQIWSRRAQGFQLVSIPADPLAEPFTEKSDPLRGPIFIPLDIECLKQKRTFLFEEFKKETWPKRLLLFQEAIVARFGFMRCAVETKTGSNQVSLDYQYVHCTGNMFILVPNSNQGLKSRQRLASAYITRHVTGSKTKDDCDAIRRTGFLWSWNHMIPNKKWKSLAIAHSEELFQLRMLRDFKDFCSNKEQRLVHFWDECWAAKEKSSMART